MGRSRPGRDGAGRGGGSRLAGRLSRPDLVGCGHEHAAGLPPLPVPAGLLAAPVIAALRDWQAPARSGSRRSTRRWPTRRVLPAVRRAPEESANCVITRPGGAARRPRRRAWSRRPRGRTSTASVRRHLGARKARSAQSRPSPRDRDGVRRDHAHRPARAMAASSTPAVATLGSAVIGAGIRGASSGCPAACWRDPRRGGNRGSRRPRQRRCLTHRNRSGHPWT